MSATHTHTHTHTRTHSHEPRLAPSGNATVMLDIGEGVGALVVHARADLCGIEIELAHRHESEAFTHTEVRERQLPEGSVYAGVFPEIAEGEYTLLPFGDAPARPVSIASGRVTELPLP
jgi:hypothetical protein